MQIIVKGSPNVVSWKLAPMFLNYPSADGHQAYGYDVKCDVSSKGVDARLRPRPNVLHLLNYDLSFRLTCSALSVRCNWGTPPSFAHHVGRTWGSLIWSLIHPLHPLHPRHQAKAVGQQVTSLTVLPFLCAASKCPMVLAVSKATIYQPTLINHS